MSVKQRLTEFIEYKGISKSEFCRTIGVSNAFVTSIVKSIQPDKLQRIALNYPDLNTAWLLTGEGGMIKGDGNQSVNGNHNTAIQGNGNQVNCETTRFLALLEKKDEQIDRLLAIIESVTNK